MADLRGDRRANTYSQYDKTGRFYSDGDSPAPFRRGSHDEPSGNQRRFLVHIDSTLESLTAQEDTDGNTQITIEDNGPKVLRLRTSDLSSYNSFDVRGTYPLSNLLQELTLAKELGETRVWLDESQLFENPVKRLSRLISEHFWDGLTRRIDATSIARAAPDPKDWTPGARSRIYIPAGAPEQYKYFVQVAKDQPDLNLDVQMLPAKLTPATARDLNDKPGLLTVAMEEITSLKDGKPVLTMLGKPFVVPGARFNELYGWDCYFISLGLLINGKVDLVKSMVENFAFCIEHYGMILNATRSYYLGRAHPPFFTDLILRVYEQIKHLPGSKDFLLRNIQAAIKEYHTVWMSEPRLDPVTGLSRYRSAGIGVPPETEPTHFVHILKPYLEKHGMTYEAFVQAYNYGEVVEPELDEYFVHDRALRESGHDSSCRVEGICGDLATVDLNSLLFKYETDIGMVIRKYCDEKLVMTEEFCHGTPYAPGEVLSSAPWDRRAKRRRMTMNKLMWDSSQGMFFDYNTKTRKRTTFESCTTLWTLWAGVATPDQASELVKYALPKFEALGGLLTTTEKSRGPVSADRPQRQWDFPFGWAPQQILAWTGLLKYGFTEDAQRLAYKWLFMMTKAFVDFNGVVTEKYDVTRAIDPHRADAEYGNQGLGFKGVNKEGFGWANASYVYGLQLLDAHMIRALGALTPYASFAKAVKDGETLS